MDHRIIKGVGGLYTVADKDFSMEDEYNNIISLLKGILTAVGVTVIGIAALALFTKDTEGSFLNTISLIIKIKHKGGVVCSWNESF